MTRYPAIIDGEKGGYGVVFPDIDGVTAMGDTIDEALINAEEALRDYAIEAQRDGDDLIAPSALETIAVPDGGTLTSVPLIMISGRTVRANMTMDAGVLEFIDGEAKRRGITRSAYLEYAAKRIAQMGG